MSARPGYKLTEIGEIPEDWEMARLGQIVKAEKGKRPTTLRAEPGGRLPYLVAESVRSDNFDKWVDPTEEVVFVDQDDIVLIWDGSQSGDVFTELKGVLASTMVKVEPQDVKVAKKFLYYFLKTKFSFLNSTTTGTAVPHISKTSFATLAVPLPSLVEQLKIASILSTVDDAIQKTDEIITETQRLKKGLMQQLLTKGIGHTKFKLTEIGEIPEEWEVVECEGLCSEITVGIVVTPARYYVESGVPCLRSFNILENEIDQRDLVYISPEANELHEKSILHKGNVVTVRTGEPGTSCVIPDLFDGANCVDLIILRPNEQIDPQFLSRFLNSDGGKRQITSWQAGSMQVHFNVGVAKRLRVPLPGKTEQQQIVQILESVEEKLSKEKQKIGQLDSLKKGLMQVLLTGRVRVKVN